MPELPEVETVARTLAPHVLNLKIRNVTLFHPPTLHPLSLPLSSVMGAAISGVRRRGKLVILDLETDSNLPKDLRPDKLVIHLRMTGRLLTRQGNPAKHTRCVFELQNDAGMDSQLFFDDIRTFGKILLANDAVLAKWPFWVSLGPEPLQIDKRTLQIRLACRKQLKAALLDQKVIAGLGNIYADEILFQAKLLPTKLASTLDENDIAQLHEAICDVLGRAIAQCGSSIRDYRDADGNVGAFQNSFKVYGRGGKKCRVCKSILHKCKVGGRTTVFCPACQK